MNEELLKILKGYDQIIVETTDENPVTIVKITSDFIDVADGYRVRMRPRPKRNLDPSKVKNIIRDAIEETFNNLASKSDTFEE